MTTTPAPERPERIKPCPHCGNEHPELSTGMGEHWVVCRKCKATDMHPSAGAAVEAWNARAMAPEQAAPVRSARPAIVDECFADLEEFKRDYSDAKALGKATALLDYISALEAKQSDTSGAQLLAKVSEQFKVLAKLSESQKVRCLTDKRTKWQIIRDEALASAKIVDDFLLPTNPEGSVGK